MLEELGKLIVSSAKFANKMIENASDENQEYYLGEEETKFIYSIPALIEQYANLLKSM